MSLKIGLVGAGDRGHFRAQTLVAAPDTVLVGIADSDRARANQLASQTNSTAFVSTPALLAASDAVCVSTPTRDHYLIAREAVRLGKPVFLEWPPATSISEAQTLVRLAEEADVAVGVSCPILVHSDLPRRSAGELASIVHLVFQFPVEGADSLNWPHELAEALALCTRLARTSVSVRLHAEAARTAQLALEAIAFTARMQNGVLVQALLHRTIGPGSKRLFLAGPDSSRSLDLSPASPHAGSDINSSAHLLDRELRGFLETLRPGATPLPPPFAIREAMTIMHLLERLMGKLR